MNKEELRKKVVTDKGRLNNNFIDLVKDILIEEFPEMKVAERAFLFFNDLSSRPTCSCGGRLKFVSFVKGYHSKCRVCKAEETCLSRYGVRKPSMLEEFKQKAILTNREKYGIDHHTQHEEIKNKKKATNLERYGYEVPGKNTKVKEKAKNTCLERYGEASSIMDANVKAKADMTNLERYGDVSPMRSEKVRQKAIETNLERYGVVNTFQFREFKEKSKVTNKLRYGTEYARQSEEISKRISISKMKKKYNGYKDALRDTHEFLFTEDEYLNKKTLHQNFRFRCKVCDSIYHSSMVNGKIPSCRKCYPRTGGTSKGEIELLEFLKRLLPDDIIIDRDRGTLDKLELDILIPGKNVAFEFNGTYWHSNQHKNKDYHITKTDSCKEKGIRLIHVFDDVWTNKRPILENRIQSILGVCEKVLYARKCTVKKIENSESVTFFQTNHLQGSAISSYQYGLFYENELVSVMTFGKPRFDKKYEWELIRFANKGGVKVVGGASRLLNRFIKEVGPKSLITYSDRCYGDTDFYESIGFKFVRNTSPGYFYIKNGSMQRVHRLSLTKKKQEGFEHYSPDLNEEENAFLNGYFKVYDSGQSIYELIPESQSFF